LADKSLWPLAYRNVMKLPAYVPETVTIAADGDQVRMTWLETSTGIRLADWVVGRKQWDSMTFSERRDLIVSHLKQPSEQAKDGLDSMLSMDSAFQSKYPALFDYLTLVVSDDGRPRRTSTVTLCVEDGAVKACLNDRQTGFQLWASSDSVDGSFGALEALLTAERTPWRRNPWAGGKQVKRS